MNLFSPLDIRPRFDAFKLAAHHLKGRYLLEVEEERLHVAPDIGDSKSPQNQEDNDE